MSEEQQCEWTRFGKSGLNVSKVILGFMSYGSKTWADWVEDDEEKIFGILKRAYDMGLRTYDTADCYSNGQSEIILGKFLKKYNIKRDKVVIFTKGYCPIDEDQQLTQFDLPTTRLDLLNSRGLSAKHLTDALEGSVRRLGTHVDVYQIHRADPNVEPEEVMRTLNNLVQRGLTRYIGASSMKTYEFIEYQTVAERHGWVKFISMQNYYNLLYREEEREMDPYCKKNGIALIPWSPVARGVLTRPASATSDRLKSDGHIFDVLGLSHLTKEDTEILNRVEELSKKHNVSMAVIASAWVIAKGSLPIIGISSEKRLEDAVMSSKLKLKAEELAYLEEPYAPKRELQVGISE